MESAANSPISLYSANYSAKFSGLDIEAVQRLEEIEPGIYRESLNARNFLGKINEQSTFSLTDKQQLRPTEYSYVRSVFGRTKTEVQRLTGRAISSITVKMTAAKKRHWQPGNWI